MSKVDMEIEGLDKKTVKADYPSNSLKQRHGKENAPVINGKVSTKKPPMAKIGRASCRERV